MKQDNNLINNVATGIANIIVYIVLCNLIIICGHNYIGNENILIAVTVTIGMMVIFGTYSWKVQHKNKGNDLKYYISSVVVSIVAVIVGTLIGIMIV